MLAENLDTLRLSDKSDMRGRAVSYHRRVRKKVLAAFFIKGVIIYVHAF